MNTIILGSVLMAVLTILSVLFYRMDKKSYYGCGWFGASFCSVIIGGIAAIVALAMFLEMNLSVPRNVDVFQSQKAYIESASKDDIQNTALTMKKVELNDWLYDAQYRRNRFSDWGIWPESILELEPIE